MNTCEVFREWSGDSSFYSEECGSATEGSGWAALFVGPFSDESIDLAEKDSGETIDPETREEIRGLGAAILYCDTQGFYALDTFASEEDARAHWAENVLPELEPENEDGELTDDDSRSFGPRR